MLSSGCPDLAEADQVVHPRRTAPTRTTVEGLTALIVPFRTLVPLGVDVIFRAVS